MLQIRDIVGDLPSDIKSPHRETRSLLSIARIVVHYDAVPVPECATGCLAYDPPARYAEQALTHMGRDWQEGWGPAVRGFGLMHHYRVSADGQVWRTQREELVTWHTYRANLDSLSVCCDLGPDQQPGTALLRGLRALLDYLCVRAEIAAGRGDVWAHCELSRVNGVRCPGELLLWVQAYRAN